MKLSIKNLLSSPARFGKQYPPLALTLMALCFLGCATIWYPDFLGEYDHLWLIVWALITGTIWGTALYSVPHRRNHAIYPLLLVALLGLAHFIPSLPDASYITILVTIMITGVISIIRYPLQNQHKNIVSIYNRIATICSGLLQGIVTTRILAGGLSLALLSVEGLFGITITNELYPTIWAVVSSLLGCSIVINYIISTPPSDTLQQAKWKNTISWVMLVLICIFCLIIYVYLAKVLITQQRPSNGVGLWGMITVGLLLVGSTITIPLLDYNEDKKVLLHQAVYIIILPILVMVSMALHQRIRQFGITEMRYLNALLIFVIGFVSILNIIKHKDHTHLLLLLISVAGFFGAVTMRPIAYWSQHGRLIDFLEKENLLMAMQNGETPSFTNEQQNVMIGYMRYFRYNQKADLSDIHPKLTLNSSYFETLKIPSYVNGSYQETMTAKWYSNKNTTTTITGYTTFYPNIDYDSRQRKQNVTTTITGGIMNIDLGSGSAVSFEIESFIANTIKIPEEKGEQVNLSLKNDNAMLIIYNVSFKKEDEDRILQNLRGDLFTR